MTRAEIKAVLDKYWKTDERRATILEVVNRDIDNRWEPISRVKSVSWMTRIQNRNGCTLCLLLNSCLLCPFGNCGPFSPYVGFNNATDLEEKRKHAKAILRVLNTTRDLLTEA